MSTENFCDYKDCHNKAVGILFITLLEFPDNQINEQIGKYICKDHFMELSKQLHLKDMNGNFGENYTFHDTSLYDEPLTDFDMENDDIIG